MMLSSIVLLKSIYQTKGLAVVYLTTNIGDYHMPMLFLRLDITQDVVPDLIKLKSTWEDK